MFPPLPQIGWLNSESTTVSLYTLNPIEIWYTTQKFGCIFEHSLDPIQSTVGDLSFTWGASREGVRRRLIKKIKINIFYFRLCLPLYFDWKFEHFKTLWHYTPSTKFVLLKHLLKPHFSRFFLLKHYLFY